MFSCKGITCFWMEKIRKKSNHNFWMEQIRVEHLPSEIPRRLSSTSLLFDSFKSPFWSKELGKEAMTCTLCSAKKSGKVSCPGSSNTWESAKVSGILRFLGRQIFLFEKLHSLKLAAWMTPEYIGISGHKRKLYSLSTIYFYGICWFQGGYIDVIRWCGENVESETSWDGSNMQSCPEEVSKNQLVKDLSRKSWYGFIWLRLI